MSRVLIGSTNWRGASRPGKCGLYRYDGADGGWSHVDQLSGASAQAIVTDPRTGTIFVGTSAGVYRSQDRGDSWAASGTGSEGHAIWSIFLHPARAGVIFAGTGPRGLLYSADGGETWVAATLDPSAQSFDLADDGVTLLPFSARVTSIAADMDRPDMIYASVEVEGLLRSRDGGRTWHDCSAALLELADAEHLQPKIGQMDARKSMADGHAVLASKGRLFYANRLGLFRSEDCGDSWEDVRLDRFSPLTYVRSVIASPADPATLYAALSLRSGGDCGTIWKSRDMGASWSRMDRDMEADSTIMALSAHPRDAALLYAASYNGQLFGTRDDGRTWQTVSGPAEAGESYAVAIL